MLPTALRHCASIFYCSSPLWPVLQIPSPLEYYSAGRTCLLPGQRLPLRKHQPTTPPPKAYAQPPISTAMPTLSPVKPHSFGRSSRYIHGLARGDWDNGARETEQRGPGATVDYGRRLQQSFGVSESPSPPAKDTVASPTSTVVMTTSSRLWYLTQGVVRFFGDGPRRITTARGVCVPNGTT